MRSHPSGKLHRAIAGADASSIVACAAGAALATPEAPHIAITGAVDVADFENNLRAAQDLAIATPVLLADCLETDHNILPARPNPAPGCPRVAINCNDDLESTLRRALAAEGPTVIAFTPAASIRRHSRKA